MRFSKPGSRIAGFVLASIVLLTVVVVTRRAASGAPSFKDGYQAVVLDNGQVYFGKVAGLGTDYPRMTDVYYILQGADAKNNDRKNVLVRRG